jgi:hypothetical protein
MINQCSARYRGFAVLLEWTEHSTLRQPDARPSASLHLDSIIARSTILTDLSPLASVGDACTRRAWREFLSDGAFLNTLRMQGVRELSDAYVLALTYWFIRQ